MLSPAPTRIMYRVIILSDSYRLSVISGFRREVDENFALLGQRVAQFSGYRQSLRAATSPAVLGGRICGLRQCVFKQTDGKWRPLVV